MNPNERIVTIASLAPQQLVSKAGKPFTKVTITTNEMPGVPISGFQNNQNKDWQIGQQVKIQLEQHPQYGWQFKLPSQLDDLKQEVEDLKNRIIVLELAAGVTQNKPVTQPEQPIQPINHNNTQLDNQEEIQVNEIPF